MKASTKRALSLILSVTLVIAALAIFTSLIRSEYANIKELRGILRSKSDLYKNEQVAITQVQNLIAEYQSAVKLGDQLSLALPNEESVASIISQLNAISRLNGIAIQSVGIEYLPIKPSLVKISSAYGIGTLRLDLKLFGSYSAFKSFLGDMEKNVRIMDVKMLRIDQGDDELNQDLFIYTLSVDTYYQAR